MGLFTQKNKQPTKEKNYHDEILNMYKKYIDKINESEHAVVKNICIAECRRIKGIWVRTFEFDIEELNALDPFGIKI